MKHHGVFWPDSERVLIKSVRFQPSRTNREYIIKLWPKISMVLKETLLSDCSDIFLISANDMKRQLSDAKVQMQKVIWRVCISFVMK